MIPFPNRIEGEKTVLKPYDFDSRWLLRRWQLTGVGVKGLNNLNDIFRRKFAENTLIIADIHEKTEKEKLIGECQLDCSTQLDKIMTFSIRIGFLYQNQGHGYDAAKSFLDYFRKACGYNITIPNTMSDNISGLCKKLGFEKKYFEGQQIPLYLPDIK